MSAARTASRRRQRGLTTLQALTPMLRTWDLPRSIAFYVEVLGFECESYSEASGWASLKRDQAAVVLAAPGPHPEATASVYTGSFYFRTDDVDALWRQLQGKARVCYPIEDFHYGMREFAIYDDSGYLLQFGQPLVSDAAVTPESSGTSG